MYQHRPVMLQQVLELLQPNRAGVYIDGTLGRAGHASAILSLLPLQSRLFVFDKDHEAFLQMPANLRQDKRVFTYHGSFADMKKVVQAEHCLGQVQGILLDLGVSSPQLDDAERGFSFMQDGPLDMRMDISKGMSAAEWLAKADETSIANVLFEFGEERFSRRIARAIVQARTEKPITTTAQLAEIVSKANPAWERHKHPATRSFQAIRIFINQELSDLQQCLADSREILAVGGRIAIISFHSLEDRIVKRFFQQKDEAKLWPKGLPIREVEPTKYWKKLGSAIKPLDSEIKENPRARSAILRIAERIS